MIFRPVESLVGEGEGIFLGFQMGGDVRMGYHLANIRFDPFKPVMSMLHGPGAWTVQHGHDWLERIEADIRQVVSHAHITTHLEPKEDPLSLADQGLDRPEYHNY